MENFSKKTLLNYVNGAGLFGAAADTQTVKFAYTENVAKVGTANEGTITFWAGTGANAGTGIIAVGNSIVSSKILDVTYAAVNNGKTGENTVTVKYFASGAVQTTTFDVLNAAAVKAYVEDYFKTSNTIDVSNGVANVRVDGATILIDESNGLKTGLNIAYIGESGSTGATIALRDSANTVLSSINVSDIVGDGVLKDSIYHQDTNILELRFGNGKEYVKTDPTTYTKVEVNLQKLIDINDVFIGNDSSVYLNATLDASTVTLDTKMQDPSTASANATGLADAWKVKQYVDSKTTDLAVSASGDNYVDASVDASDKKHINVAATDKTKTAVALAETAVQSVVEGTSVEGYVALNISTKSDASVITITTNDSSLSAKLTEVDASIDALQAKDVEIDASIDALQAKDEEIDASIAALKAKDVEIDSSIAALKAKDVEIDSSIDRLDTSVSAIETAIAGMDAELSVNTLDGSIGITLSETDGKVTAIGVTATKATVTFDNTGDEPSLTSTSGLLVGDAIAPIKNYIDTIAEQGFDGLDSEVEKKDSSNFIGYKVGIVDGKLLDSSCSLTAVFGDYDATSQTDGLATTGATKTYIDSEIQSLDLANDVADASASDVAGFVKTVISETDGIVKNESVTVTYGDYGTHANGIAKTADTSVFVE